MTHTAVVYDTAMVKDTVCEIAATHTMAYSAILYRIHMIHCSRLTACIDTIVIIMAAGATLHTGIHKTVVEYTAEVKGGGLMADITIDSHDRVAGTGAYGIAAIVTTGAIVRDVTVIDEGRYKRRRGVAGITVGINGCGYMKIMFTNRNRPVVAGAAFASNISMIKFSIQPQLQEAVRTRVAFIAFGIRLHVKFRFSDRLHTIMATAAITEHFEMINITNQIKSECCVTGFTHITGRDMVP